MVTTDCQLAGALHKKAEIIVNNYLENFLYSL